MTRLVLAALLFAGCRRVPQTPEERCAAAGMRLVYAKPTCERVLRCDGRGPGVGCRLHQECEQEYRCEPVNP